MKMDFKRKISLFMAIVMMICTMSNISIMAETNGEELSTEIISEEIDDSAQSEETDIIDNEETSQEEVSQEQSSEDEVVQEIEPAVSENEDVVLFEAEDKEPTDAAIITGKEATVNDTLNFPDDEGKQKIKEYGVTQISSEVKWELKGVSSTGGTNWKPSSSEARNATFENGSTSLEGAESVVVKTKAKNGYFVLKAIHKETSEEILRYQVTIRAKKATAIALTPTKTTSLNGLVLTNKADVEEKGADKIYNLAMVVPKEKDQVLTNAATITIIPKITLATSKGTKKTSSLDTTLTGSGIVSIKADKTTAGYSKFDIKALKAGSGQIIVNSDQLNMYDKPEQKAIINLTVSKYPDTAKVDEDEPLHIRAGEKIEFSYSSTAGVYYKIEGKEKVELQEGSEVDPNITNKDIKWVIHNAKGKASSSAKFETIGKKGKIVPVSTIKETDKVKLINTKANRTLNGLVHVKAVNAVQPGIVYADFQVAIRPTMIERLVVGPVETAKKNGVKAVEGKTDEYELELNMGAKFKLTAVPRAATTSKAVIYNKAVKYEVVSGSSSVITVSNTGIINPISAVETEAAIKISTLETFDGTDKPVKEAKVIVKINPLVKTLMLNTTSLKMAPKSSQRFILATSPLTTYGAKVKVEYDDKAVTLYQAGTDTKIDKNSIVTVNGVIPFEVKVNEGIETKEDFGAPNIMFTYAKATGTDVTDISKAKPVKVKLSFAPVLGNIVKINQAFKTTNGVVTLNVPVGVPTNLKVSVTPSNAFNEIEWKATGSSVSVTNIDNYVEIRNGWVIPKDVGTFEFAGVAQGVTAKGEKLSTYTYRINIYKPTSIIGVKAVPTEGKDYTIYAGYLMDKDVTLTTNDPLIEGGKWINLDTVRSNGSTEKITWTSGNPAAVTIKQEENGKFSIYLNSPGTYVITGRSEFSKLKYSFRVKVKEVYSAEIVKENTQAEGKPDVLEKRDISYQYVGDLKWNEYKQNESIVTDVGKKVQLAVGIEDEVAAKLKWTLNTPADKAKVAITTKGLVTPKVYTKEPVELKYEYYSTTKGLKQSKIDGTVLLRINDPDVTTTITSKIPEFASKEVNLKLKASIKGTKASNVTNNFYYSKDGGAATKLSDGLSADFKPESKGTYEIWSETKSNNTQEVLYTTPKKQIKLLDVMVYKANVTTPTINAVQRTSGQTFEVSILASAKDTKQVPDVEKVIWSSSNYNVAYAQETTTTKGAYATAIITVGENAFGKATITGTLNNSGRKVKIVVSTVEKDILSAPSKLGLSITPSTTRKFPESDAEDAKKIPVKVVPMNSETTAVGKLTVSPDQGKKVVPGRLVWYVDVTGGQNYTKYNFDNPDPNLPIEIDRLGKIKLKSGKSIGDTQRISITAGYEYKDPKTGKNTEIKAIDGEGNNKKYYQLVKK